MMGIESVRGYLQLAAGLGDLTKARAVEAAQGLLSLPGVSTGTGKVGQVGVLAEELLAAATANRESLVSLIRNEVDAAVLRLGLVPADQLEHSRQEVARLEAEVASLRAASASSQSEASAPGGRKAPTRRPAAKTEAAKAKSAKTESAKTEAAKAKSAETESAKTEAARTESAKTAAAKTTAPKTAAPKTPAPKTPATKTGVTPAPRSAVTTRRPAGEGA